MSLIDDCLVVAHSGKEDDQAAIPIKAVGIGIDELGTHLEELEARFNGLGKTLAPLIHLPGITDILVNSTQVWADCGQGVQPAGCSFDSEEEVRELAVTMAGVCGKRLDDAVPIVDGVLPMGIRLHAVIPPLSGGGTLISLRIPARNGLSIEQMREMGSIDNTSYQVLMRALDMRCNILISGATGSGKTTLLAALLGTLPHGQRLICIEGSRTGG